MKKAAGLTTAVLLSTLLIGGGSLFAAKPTATTTHPFVTIGGINPGGPMNFFSPSGNIYPGLDLEPLAYHILYSPNINAFFPNGGLASKWQVSNGGHTITVWLNPQARWSNDQPVTSKDVITSFALYFVNGTAQGFDLGSVKALSMREIQFNEFPGDHYGAFWRSVLEQFIVPASVYDVVLPNNIWTTIDQSLYSGSKPTLVKQAHAAQAELTKISKLKLDALAPKTDVSAGPYYISSLTSGEVVMTKNPYFYLADRIHIPTVDLRDDTGAQVIWEWLRGGQIYQATSGGMSLNLVHQLLHTPGNVLYRAPAYVSSQLAFNEHRYPFNLVQVRQAIAYLMNKQTIWKISEPVSGTRSLWSDGMIDLQTKEYLTATQRAQLNPYNPNLKKAASLLESVGFKKRNGNWYMPNGKQFTIDLYNVSGFEDWIMAGTVMEHEFGAFGIKTTQTIVPSFSEYLKAQSGGDYAVSLWLGSLGPWIYDTYDRLYGPIDGYSVSGTKLTYTPASKKDGGNWLDFPKTVNVKGYGMVSPGVLTNKLAGKLTPGQIKAIVAKLAAATNQYLPVITFTNLSQAGFVNTKYFTDYPLSNRKLMVSAEGFYPPIGVWETFGYVHPK